MSQATFAKGHIESTRARVIRTDSKWLLIAQFFVFLIGGLILLEPILSLAGVAEEEVLEIDEKTGWTLMPGRTFTYRTEGYSRSTINSLGMRDVERTVAKPANTYRIAVLGCSLTEGKQVDLDKTYCQLLEKRLNKGNSPVKYEVLNFAVSAYSLGQEYLRLKHKALQFKPDLVIFTARPNSLLFMGPTLKTGFLHSPPLFGVLPDGTLFEDHNKQKMWLASADGIRTKNCHWLRRNSRLWGLAGRCVLSIDEFYDATVIHLRKLWSGEFSVEQTAKNDTEKKLSNNRNSKFRPEMVFLGRVAEAVLKAAKNDCQKADCKFVLAYLPASEKYRDPAEREIFESIAQRQKLNFIDFNPEFDRLEKEGNNNFYVVVHFSKAGNEAVEKYLYRQLVLQDLLK
jgi:hypothetical protein